jgi:hypothetical protein
MKPVVSLDLEIPPHNLEAERAVLGAMIDDPASLAHALDALVAGDFFKEGHRTIFETAAVLAGQGLSVDLVTVSAELERRGTLADVGGPAALATLVEVAAVSANTASYARIIRDLSLKRELLALGIELASPNGAAGPALLTQATSRVARLGARHGKAIGDSPLLPVGEGLGAFLARDFPDAPPLVEGILSADGCGWIAGEEKLGKSWYALHEALALALGVPVAGRFAVSASRRVLYVQEEDSARRTSLRVKALLRGFDLDPAAPAVRTLLDEWLRISVWAGFTLDDPTWLARLDATCAAFRPAVVYLDVLRKLTTRDLNKADQAGAMLAGLDELRRRHGVLFRVVHHYRKAQGVRFSRGSQEMGGSFVLGAWGECSLFFEPVGRTQGAVRVAVQVKDGPPLPSFRLTLRADGPDHAPTRVTLSAEPEGEDASADDVILQALAAAPAADAITGRPGVPLATLVAVAKQSESTCRRALLRLVKAGTVEVVGHAAKGANLYGVVGHEPVTKQPALDLSNVP